MPYIVLSGNHSDKKIPKMRGQVLWSITFILEAFYESVVCNIELESVSAAVRADSNLNKVHSFLEKDLLLILRTFSLIL